jgi:probable HAF family extracellular repeat protein
MNWKIASHATLWLIGSGLGVAQAEILFRARALPWLPNHLPPNWPQALSDSQQIAGYSATYDDFGQLVWIGFRFDHDSQSYVVLESSPGVATTPLAITDSGLVAGLGWSAHCELDSWFWTAQSGMTIFGDLPGGLCSTRVEAVNNLDQAVGLAHSSNGEEAFLWTRQEGMIGLGDLPGGCFASRALDINDNAWIVGYGCSMQILGAGFLWTPADGMLAMNDVVNGALPYVQTDSVNNQNQIAGTFGPGSGRRLGYLWESSGDITILPWLSSDPSETQAVLALSDQTHVLGVATTTGEFEYIHTPFIWAPRRGIRAVADLLDPCRPEYQTLLGVIDVNANGWILARVGIQNPNSEHGSVVLIPYIPGDVDENEICDLQDLAIQLSNFSREGDAEYQHGDLDCDQDVDLQDLAILLGNFGETLP